MHNFLTLLKKELRQNSLIFSIPYLFFLLVWLARHQPSSWLSPEWTQVLGTALPVALAGAYGLQAFDSEENTQTRDFLLAKPLNIGQIVGCKYLPGLIMLHIFNLGWQWFLQPQSLQLPDIFNLRSLWLSAFVLILTCIYSVSFVTGLLIKGPQKLLVALGCGFLLAGWFFWGWSETITALYFLNWSFLHPTFLTYVTILLTLGLNALVARISLTMCLWRLSNLAYRDYRAQLNPVLVLILVFPLAAHLGTMLQKPVIRPFECLALSFFQSEPWFISIQAVKQPGSSRFASFDTAGRIALVKEFAKPQIIIRTANKAKINQLSWSPDGHFLCFTEDRFIKTYQLTSRKIEKLLPGDVVYWSADNTRLLIAQVLKTQYKIENGFKVPSFTIKFTLFDRKQQAPVYWAHFNALPTRTFAWDSSRQELLALDPSWSLKRINLTKNQTETLNFLHTIPDYERITLSQINQIGPSRYDILICSIDQQSFLQRRNQFNLRWYTYDSASLQIQLQTTLTGLPATQLDLILDSANHRLLSNSGNGVYYPIYFRRQPKK